LSNGADSGVVGNPDLVYETSIEMFEWDSGRRKVRPRFLAVLYLELHSSRTHRMESK